MVPDAAMVSHTADPGHSGRYIRASGSDTVDAVIHRIDIDVASNICSPEDSVRLYRTESSLDPSMEARIIRFPTKSGALTLNPKPVHPKWNHNR